MSMIAHNKMIGRVLSVDNFRLFIKIDEELRGAYKSGIHNIYEVARINSYLIIPVGSEKVVALITRVSMKEEIEFDRHSASITLPTSARYISATMLGTIQKTGNKEKFIQGIYNFPALDNPVWYVTEKDLAQIFDECQDKEKIDYTKDFYMPIGTSPTFPGYSVKICPDQLFVKHAAILGNTGSGKSCTFTSIIRNLFKYDYGGKNLENAHFIIFDTNGEYKDAFVLNSSNDAEEDCNRNQLKKINAYYYGGETHPKVPYWFMNWNDFKNLLRPSDGIQAPVLNRAIGLAKNERESRLLGIIPRHLCSDIESILNTNSEDLKKRTGRTDYGNWKFEDNNAIIKIGEAVKDFNEKLGDAIIELGGEENFNNAAKQTPIREIIQKLWNEIIRNNIDKQIINDQNIDLPLWFDYQKLCSKFIDAAITQDGSNNNRIAEFISTLRLRMNGFLNDNRIALPLMLKDSEEDNKNILCHFIAFLLGDFNRFFKDDAPSNSFIKCYNDSSCYENINKTSQITIIDVSNLPFEILETITALLGRIIIEFVSYFTKDRGKYPIVIVLEEAQNYIAEQRDSLAKTVFERIAREGRKYGVSLVVCSQRPSELSKTVLSQCNSFVIHRLQNPDDQKYVRGLVSSANADILDQLPVIPQQHAIITGDCVRTPIQVRIDDVSPTPNSHNPQFISQWLTDLKIPYEDACKRWVNNKHLQEIVAPST